jgi:hypothetical protein
MNDCLPMTSEKKFHPNTNIYKFFLYFNSKQLLCHFNPELLGYSHIILQISDKNGRFGLKCYTLD